MRTFLKIVGLLTVVAIIVTIVLSGLIYKSQKARCAELLETDKRLLETHKRFPIHQLSLSHIQINAYGRIRGRLTNGSNQEISSFWVNVTAEDCVGENCVPVGEQRYLVRIHVPPGEARDFDEDISVNDRVNDNAQLADIQPRGTVRFYTRVSIPQPSFNYELVQCHECGLLELSGYRLSFQGYQGAGGDGTPAVLRWLRRCHGVGLRGMLGFG